MQPNKINSTYIKSADTKLVKNLENLFNDKKGKNFKAIINLLNRLGLFVERQKGSHVIIRDEQNHFVGNIQPDKEHKAKPYQIKQIKEKLHELNEEKNEDTHNKTLSNIKKKGKKDKKSKTVKEHTYNFVVESQPQKEQNAKKSYQWTKVINALKEEKRVGFQTESPTNTNEKGKKNKFAYFPTSKEPFNNLISGIENSINNIVTKEIYTDIKIDPVPLADSIDQIENSILKTELSEYITAFDVNKYDQKFNQNLIKVLVMLILTPDQHIPSLQIDHQNVINDINFCIMLLLSFHEKKFNLATLLLLMIYGEDNKLLPTRYQKYIDKPKANDFEKFIYNEDNQLDYYNLVIDYDFLSNLTDMELKVAQEKCKKFLLLGSKQDYDPHSKQECNYLIALSLIIGANGFEEDEESGINFLKSCAETGMPSANLTLANIYKKSFCYNKTLKIKKDLDAASKYYYKTLERIEVLYPEESIKYYKKADNQEKLAQLTPNSKFNNKKTTPTVPNNLWKPMIKKMNLVGYTLTEILNIIYNELGDLHINSDPEKCSYYLMHAAAHGYHDAFYNLALLHALQKKDHSAALSWIDKCEKADPQVLDLYSFIYHDIAKLHYQKKDFQEALIWLDKCDKTNQKVPEFYKFIYYDIATLHYQKKDFQEALIWLDKCDKSNKNVLLTYISIYTEQKNTALKESNKKVSAAKVKLYNSFIKECQDLLNKMGS